VAIFCAPDALSTCEAQKYQDGQYNNQQNCDHTGLLSPHVDFAFEGRVIVLQVPANGIVLSVRAKALGVQGIVRGGKRYKSVVLHTLQSVKRERRRNWLTRI
jgi:hypothetical protein